MHSIYLYGTCNVQRACRNVYNEIVHNKTHICKLKKKTELIQRDYTQQRQKDKIFCFVPTRAFVL